jgi:hypothetical protein
MDEAERQDLLHKTARQAGRIADELESQASTVTAEGKAAMVAVVAAARRVVAASQMPQERRKQ